MYVEHLIVSSKQNNVSDCSQSRMADKKNLNQRNTAIFTPTSPSSSSHIPIGINFLFPVFENDI